MRPREYRQVTPQASECQVSEVQFYMQGDAEAQGSAGAREVTNGLRGSGERGEVGGWSKFSIQRLRPGDLIGYNAMRARAFLRQWSRLPTGW